MPVQPSIPASRFGRVALATFVLSFSVLVFEVALTRLFSVMLSYHFVFAIVSFALLGLGLGGLLLQTVARLFSGPVYPASAALLALSMASSVLLIVGLPIYANPALADLRLWIYFLLALLPFVFAGLTLAELFQTYAARSSVLYGFDLLGATLGALAVVALLNRLGGVAAALFAGSGAALGALLLAWAAGIHRPLHYLPLPLVLILLLALPSQMEVPVALDPGKDLYRFLKNPEDTVEVVERRWSAFGRTDLVRSRRMPEQMSLFVDGAAGSAMYDLDLLRQDEALRAHLLRHFGAFFPFYFLAAAEKDSALVIGAGGGRDVVVALLGDVPSITAVEVNPDVVQLVRDYADFNGGIYAGHPNVRAVVREGRDYLRTSRERFDLIMLALPVTKSSRSVEGYALTENYLFTIEAFEAYLDHLTPEGRLVIVAHNIVEQYRLLILTLSAFQERGVEVAQAMQHVYTLAPGLMPTLIVRKQPFDSLEAQQRHALIHQLRFDQGSYFVPFESQLAIGPDEQLGLNDEWRMFDQVLVELSRGNLTLEALIASTPFDLRPVTDDSPFFYKFEPGLPSPFGIFAGLIVGMTGLLMVVLVRRRRYTGSTSPLLRALASIPQMRRFVGLFFVLGMGFMLLEVALFQKLTLYLGQPVRTLTVLLFSLLLGTGLGSLCSACVRRQMGRAVIAASLLTAALAVAYSASLPAFFALPLDARLVATLALLPLGFFLGFPFPLAIRLMHEQRLAHLVDWMWGVNGIASVLGAALAMILGILLGFSHALYVGALLYVGVALLTLQVVRPVAALEPAVKKPA